jgi:hypothetical protein
VNNIETLSELSSREVFSKLLDSLASDDRWLVEVDSRSYFHANNFAKIVLLSGAEANWKLRLHIWWPQPDKPPGEPEDIHSHRWDFTTSLLAGEYLATEYAVVPNGLEHYQYEYTPAGASSSFKLKSCGQASLVPVFEARLPQGTVYHITHELLHRVSSTSQSVTATLMIQGPALSKTTKVFATAPLVKDQEEDVPLKRMGVASLEQQLDRLRASL